ncbi:MAG: helix-hairpin-helix domain-containing protein, partial [Desulfobacula sp.]|nr:helix-hairpin-helix domain-containing protein [Desulfobacula sp.]
VFATTDKININSATKSELVILKHVGDKIADKIMEYRKAHPFETPQDIMKVKGIGQKTFDANKDLIIVKDI